MSIENISKLYNLCRILLWCLNLNSINGNNHILLLSARTLLNQFYMLINYIFQDEII